jgi:hypothetical protein
LATPIVEVSADTLPTPVTETSAALAVVPANSPEESASQKSSPLATMTADKTVFSRVASARARRGVGAVVLAFVFKAIGILIWIASVAAFLAPGSDLLSGLTPSNLTDFLNIFVNDSTLVTLLIGFIVGLAFFGIGELIALLNDIRRNTR